MLKINLLPPYIREKKLIRMTIFMMAPVLLLIVGGIFGWWTQINKNIADTNAKLAAADLVAKQAEALQAEKTAVDTSVADMRQIVDFVDSVRAYNLKLPSLLDLVASWTYKKVQINGLEVAGGGPGGAWDRINLTCTTDTLDSLYASMNNLWNATNVFSQASLLQTSPSISYPLGSDTSGGGGGGSSLMNPSYRMGSTAGTPSMRGSFGGGSFGGLSEALSSLSPQGYTFQVGFMLKTPIAVPEYGASAAGAAGAPGAEAGPASGVGPGATTPPPSGGDGGGGGDAGDTGGE